MATREELEELARLQRDMEELEKAIKKRLDPKLWQKYKAVRNKYSDLYDKTH